MKAHIFRIAAAFLAAGLAFSQPAFAVSNGITGLTLKSTASGCSSCHGPVGNVASVVISGPSVLNAGQGATYTVTANQTTPAAGVKMGVDIAVSDNPSSLSVIGGQSTILSGTAAVAEVIHNLPTGALHTTSGGSANYQFTYTMPAAAAGGSTHTIYATAALSFTGWGNATNFTVTTAPPGTTAVTPSNVTSSTVDLAWTGGGPEYRVVYKTGAAAPVNETDGTMVTLGAVTSTTITGLTPSTQYTFKVFSKLTGLSVFSSTGATTTITTTTLSAAARYVNAGSGVNSGTCAVQANPCKTITYAMAQAAAGNPGDLVSVAPGTYNLALGEVFPIVFKSGVQLVSTGTPSNTIIDAAGDTVKLGVITSSGNASASSRIDGFTIANGLNTPGQGGSATGGGVRISSAAASFTVTRNIFSGNESRGYSADGTLGQTGGLGWGGGLYVFSSTVNVTNNVFVDNIARGGNGLSHLGTPLTGNENAGPGEGGAIYFGGSGTVINNTFYGNDAIGGNGGGSSTGTGNGGGGTNGAVSASGAPSPTFANNIFVNNASISGTGGTPGASSAGAMSSATSPAIRNNLFFGNLVNSGASTGDSLGTASLASDPQFHAAPGNLHILPTSPANAAGSAIGAPASDLDGVVRPNPPAIGAYEPSTQNPPRLANISTRGQVQTGFNVMIGGFVISGSGPKTVIVRATGPSLANFGVSGAISNPTLQLVRADQTVIATNDDWGSAPNAAQITASGFAPSNPLESAILTTLPPGAYTAIVSGVGGATGIGLVEVYEVDHPEVALINISTRGQVQSGFNVMIGGFVIQGSGPETVVIRAIGPSLANFGVSGALANPTMSLVRMSDQATIATNDDWGSASNAAQITASGFAPSNPLESAILMTLAPGAYTAVVSGVAGGTGVGLVEVYKVGP